MTRHSHQHFTLHNSTNLAASTVVVVVGVLIVANIWLSATLSHLGIYLKDMENKSVSLKKTTQTVQQNILAETALTDLAVKAENLGFTQKVQPLKLPGNPSVAYRQ